MACYISKLFMRSSNFSSKKVLSSLSFFSTKLNDFNQNKSHFQKENNLFNDLNLKFNEIKHSLSTNLFSIYLKENLKDYALKHPELPKSQIWRNLCKEWKNMPIDEKMAYFDKAKENKILKQSALKDFFSSMTTEQIKAFKLEMKTKKFERLKRRQKSKIRKENIMHGRPPRPMSAFFLFRVSLYRKDASFKLMDFNRLVLNKWKALSESEKDVFLKKANLLRNEYNFKLIEWEARMVAEGRLHLVSKSFKKALEKELFKLASQ